MDEIAATRVTLSERHVHHVSVNAVEPSECFVISAQNNFVISREFNADTVICEGSVGVEVEDENVTIAFEADDLVTLVCPRHVARVFIQPAVLFFCQVHCAVELIQEFVL